MRTAEAILTDLQQTLAPLTHAAFDSDAVYGAVSEKIERLRMLEVDELLLGAIDFQTRVIVGMEDGDPGDATAAVLNEIAVWKEENCK